MIKRRKSKRRKKSILMFIIYFILGLGLISLGVSTASSLKEEKPVETESIKKVAVPGVNEFVDVIKINTDLTKEEVSDLLLPLENLVNEEDDGYIYIFSDITGVKRLYIDFTESNNPKIYISYDDTDLLMFDSVNGWNLSNDYDLDISSEYKVKDTNTENGKYNEYLKTLFYIEN